MLVIDPNTNEQLPQSQYDPDRPRSWHSTRLGDTVILRHCAILKPGEDLTENPPTHELTPDEWAAIHEQYGLDVDGRPVAAAT